MDKIPHGGVVEERSNWESKGLSSQRWKMSRIITGERDIESGNKIFKS